MSGKSSLMRLATYGTLAPGRPNHHQVAHLKGRWISGVVKGHLLRAGWGASLGFPGLVLDDNGQSIEVDILESSDLPQHWERLDEFEGEGYSRVETVVATEHGTLSVSIYVLSDKTQGKPGAPKQVAVDAFPLKTSDKLRYADTDRQGHVNNAVFATFLESGRVEVLYQEELADSGAAFVIARLELDFLSEVTWPGSVEIGTAVLEVGRSSFKLFQKVYQDGVAVAKAVTVIVQMNEETRKSQPLSEKARNRLSELIRSALDT